MTYAEIEIAEALGTIQVPLGSKFDKQFINGLSTKARAFGGDTLTTKQEEWLYRLLYKYRKQLPVTYEKYKDNAYCTQKNDSHLNK